MTEWKDDRKKAVPRRQAIPKMPEGYYSGDKPNPNLRAFVEAHLQEQPYDPESDKYGVPAFDHPIESTKATAIYNMHTYWSKKPHNAIMEYIRHYTNPGDLVLDPFCGSGGTALAALMEGRKAIAIDRSPAATFITKNYCTPVDVDELRAAFGELKAKVKPEIDWLYETKCDRCGGEAMTAYTVYSQIFQCPRCMEKVALFDCPEVEGRTQKGKLKKVRVCPHCERRGIQEQIKSTGEHFGAVPVLVSYICENGCKPARSQRRHDDSDLRKREYFEKYDLEKIGEIEEKDIPHWYPEADLKNAIPYRMLFKKDFRPDDASKLTDLFTKRNLWALAAIKEAIGQPDISIPTDSLYFALNSILLNCSNLYRYRSNLKGGFQAGTYYIPQESQIINVWRAYEDKYRDFIGIATTSNISYSEMIISTQSAIQTDLILSNSIDYIFTDPPYAGKIQYGELNFIWEAWLDFDTHWQDEEITINEIRGKTVVDWANDMSAAMCECYRVLKPGRCISLCYHADDLTWTLLQDLMAKVGFLTERTDSAIYIDTGQKTYNQITADKVNKRDLVINFRKPKPDELGVPLITELDDFGTFQDKAKNIIANYLSSNPGSTKDRIYDEVVSRMVRRGMMEPHQFDELLSHVAEPVHPEGGNLVARWYLRETGVEDTAESAKEDAAAEAVAKFISLRKKPEEEGVHHSDIFEHFVYTVKDKPRRPLGEWILDYFYKTDEGTYRLPTSPEEEQIKMEGRASGVSRQIKRYLAYLEQGVPVPAGERPGDATIADWIRHCKRSGMYEQGKLLYERGGLDPAGLSELEQVNLEEDYDVCARMLVRVGGAEKKTKRTRKVKMAEEHKT